MENGGSGRSWTCRQPQQNKEPAQGRLPPSTTALQPTQHPEASLSSFFSVPMFSVPGHVGNEEPLSQMGALWRARIFSKVLKMLRATEGGVAGTAHRVAGQLSLGPNPMPTHL